ncbi:cytochrome P450 [Aspergillus karnatakaensis]|uniref:cytochrome P450 n=1 Tax=Aspergillus karnatakaensis TaxID=1810916 RepID=UPI003CCDC06F
MEVRRRALIVQGALIGVITYWVIWIVYARYFHPLSRFPGPFWASITRIWTLLHVLPGDAEKTQRALHARYGPVVRIAPNELVTSDPGAIQTLYGFKSSTAKTDFYLAFRPPWARFPDHFSSEGGKQHAARRRIVSHVYSLTSILQSEEYIDKCLDVWVDKLGEIADRKDSFDLWIWTRMYAYDVIGELYFSKMFGFLEAGGDHLGYIGATDDLIPIQFLAGNMPTYIRSFFMLAGIVLIPKVRRALKALGDLTEATNVMLKNRLASLQSADSDSVPQRQDILGKLLNISQKRGDELDFVLDDIKMESFGGFFAGSETTAVTLSGILYHVLRTPTVYAKLTAEIDAALPYLSACIKEGIRMHPITGVSFPRHAPSDGCEIGGRYIPPNARIGVNPGIIHFDKTVFGEDADQFRPERWLEDEEGASNMDRHVMQFGIGARTCLGKHLSMCEIYKAVPQILRTFSLEMVTRELQTTSYWLLKPVAIEVNVRRR